ncbi:hypothetical protein BCR34DRAFT_487196 [Clohesyomyces aquaticus]|uniref:Uncharacterized protein n=1 Tax=Clohesyomyces aquaticus TaxID=1231657 RepID=A0A1Y1ZGN7_9PLEO|nr:hypothetical protein BCR34DRAFT_487196 [Clohesyomyces aquaticus]
MANLTLGKSLMSLIALVTIIGPYLADWSKTHVLNPNWPPHARFHNGQTMTTGALLGLLSLYYLHSPAASHSPALHPLSALNHALLFLHLYYVPALSGILYPGADWMDPEFGEGRPQLYFFSVVLAVAWVGWWIEKRRIEGVVGKEGKGA